MPDPIKVLPTTSDEVGLVHPVDGALAAEGSLWSYDAFTMRQLTSGAIRRFEADVDGAVAPKPAAAEATPTADAATAASTAAATKKAP